MIDQDPGAKMSGMGVKLKTCFSIDAWKTLTLIDCLLPIDGLENVDGRCP